MRRPLVLLVDSSEDTRDIYRTALEWHGYGIAEAADAATGLEIATAMRPDVIIGDFPLSHGGRSLTSALRDVPELAGLRFLAVTSRAMSHEVARAEDVSDMVLVKPVLPGRVVEAVEQLVGPPLEPGQSVPGV